MLPLYGTAASFVPSADEATDCQPCAVPIVLSSLHEVYGGIMVYPLQVASTEHFVWQSVASEHAVPPYLFVSDANELEERSVASQY